MIEVEITKAMLSEAKRRNVHFKKKFGNHGTHRRNKERQRMTGYLAEAAIKSIFPQLEYSDDIVVDDITFDSKAQGCNSVPKSHFSATLYKEQRDRPVDFYIFSRVCNDFETVWICGIASKVDFFERSELIKAGTRNTNFTYDQARYEVAYYDLDDTEETIAELTTLLSAEKHI